MHNKSFPLRCPTYMKVSSSITPDQSLIRSCVETLINLDDLTNQPLLNCSQGQELGWSSSLQMQRWQLTWVLEVHLLLCCWFPPRVPTGPDTDKSAATEKWFDDEVITLYMYYYRWSMIKSTVVLSFDWPSLIHHFEAEWVLNGSVGVGAMMAAAVWDGSTNFVRMAFEYHLNHRSQFNHVNHAPPPPPPSFLLPRLCHPQDESLQKVRCNWVGSCSCLEYYQDSNYWWVSFDFWGDFWDVSAMILPGSRWSTSHVLVWKGPYLNYFQGSCAIYVHLSCSHPSKAGQDQLLHVLAAKC